jgi:hypothetical protein
MRNVLIKMMAVCILSAGCFAADDDPKIPNGVHYKTAPDDVNEAARKKLEKIFIGKPTDAEVLALFEQKVVICGPGLWQTIKDAPEMAKLENGNVKMVVPVLDKQGKTKRTYEMAGKLFQSDDEILAFWKVFTARAPISDFRIRKLTSDELTLYWSMISFDRGAGIYYSKQRPQNTFAIYVA